MTNTEFRTGVIRPIECVKEGFELIKKDYWLLFAIALVGGLLGGVTMYVLAGAMFCGIFLAYLRAVDGKPIVFDDLWKGMNYFGPGLVVMLVFVVPAVFYYVFVYITLIAAMLGGAQAGGAGLVGALIVIGLIDLVVLIVMTCFHTLLTFSFPLLVDRNLGAIDAMKLSGRAVWHNLSGVAGLILVNIGLMVIGSLALCFGLYFVMPIIIAGNVVAYRRVFPSLEMRPSNMAPPPPNAYNWS
ncbi:MAG TPA: hypothetical protein VNA22_05210 [Pyrinomonadaceae bacterium]|nr:hypothetical protein [Pyrinomonadaceae bacterium]